MSCHRSFDGRAQAQADECQAHIDSLRKLAGQEPQVSVVEVGWHPTEMVGHVCLSPPTHEGVRDTIVKHNVLGMLADVLQRECGHRDEMGAKFESSEGQKEKLIRNQKLEPKWLWNGLLVLNVRS